MTWRAVAACVLMFAIAASAQPNEIEANRFRDSAAYYSRRDFDKTLAFANQAEASMTTAQRPSLTEEIYLIRFNSSRFFFRLRDARQYVESFAAFVIASEDLLGEDYKRQLEESRLWLAEYYFDVGNHQAAITLFTSAVAALDQLPPSIKTFSSLYRAMLAMATIQTMKGEYEAAVNQFLAAKRYGEYLDREMKIPEHARHRDDLLLYRNVANVLLNKNDFPRARLYLDLALREFNAITPKQLEELGSSSAIAMFESLSVYYMHTNKNDSALIALQRTLPLLAASDPFRSRVFKGLGDVYAGMRNYSRAKTYYEQAIALKRNEGETKSIPLSTIWFALGNLYEQTGSVDEGLRCYHRSLNSLLMDRSEDDESLPVLENILAKKNLFEVFKALSKLYFTKYKATQDDNALNVAWDFSKLNIALLDSAINDVGLQKDKIIVAEQCFSAYENAIRIGHEQFNKTGDGKFLNECFMLMDKSKGTMLLENLRLVNSFAGVDPVWFERERQLQTELSLFEQALYKAELDHSKDLSKLNALRSDFASRKHEHSELLRKIKTEAPDYYKLRFDHSVLGTMAVQQDLLEENQGLITFFVGDSTLVVSGFSKAKHHFSQKPIPENLNSAINSCRLLIRDPDQDAEKLTLELKTLYDLLLADCLRTFDSTINTLIIIPDGILGYVPFEVLPSPRRGPYLINDYAVRYAHSASYLYEQNRKETATASEFFGGFASPGAPTTASKDRVDGRLIYAQEEVESIAAMTHQAVVYSPAKKEDFIADAFRYRVLHLAMHSVVNDADPMQSVMVFALEGDGATNDHLLSALELYNFRLNADLAVLSACNTGSGELHRGEGIMSFSRAFSYAGVPSALISLWKVPDKATSKIMLGFYSHLKAGDTKSEALRKAKLEFVERYPAMKHPYYWSGFIVAGNDEPIPFPANFSWVMWTALLLAFAGATAATRRYLRVVRAKSQR